MTKERWLPVIGYEGIYEVSDLGRVKRLKFTYNNQTNIAIDRILKDKFVTGYVHHILSHKGKLKNVFAHVLVAEAFIGPKPQGFQVNHKDGNKGNPRLENLEYVTRSQNCIHAIETGLYVPLRGEKHWTAKLSDNQIRRIRRRALAGEKHDKLAAEYKCSIAAISPYRNRVGRAAEIW